MTEFQVHGLEVLECQVSRRTEKMITYTLPNGMSRTERTDGYGKPRWFNTRGEALAFALDRTCKLISDAEAHLSTLKVRKHELEQLVR